MTFDDRIEQLATLVSGLNKRVAVLELSRLSPQVNAPSPTPEGTPPPVAASLAAPQQPLAGPQLLETGLKAPPDALAAYQQRCKARLVAKAQADDLLPFWHQHAVACGWIKPTETIEALLTNDAEVFWFFADKNPADQAEDIRLQFKAMAAAVAKLAENNCPF